MRHRTCIVFIVRKLTGRCDSLTRPRDGQTRLGSASNDFRVISCFFSKLLNDRALMTTGLTPGCEIATLLLFILCLCHGCLLLARSIQPAIPFRIPFSLFQRNTSTPSGHLEGCSCQGRPLVVTPLKKAGPWLLL